jgi:hypothetical protein
LVYIVMVVEFCAVNSEKPDPYKYYEY